VLRALDGRSAFSTYLYLPSVYPHGKFDVELRIKYLRLNSWPHSCPFRF
jgi:hypothetical protein